MLLPEVNQLTQHLDIGAKLISIITPGLQDPPPGNQPDFIVVAPTDANELPFSAYAAVHHEARC